MYEWMCVRLYNVHLCICTFVYTNDSLQAISQDFREYFCIKLYIRVHYNNSPCIVITVGYKG